MAGRASQEAVRKIRRLRKIGWSISDIAKMMDVSPTTVRNWLEDARLPKRKLFADVEIAVIRELALLLRWPASDAVPVLSRIVPFRGRSRPNDRTYRRALEEVLPEEPCETRKPEKWCPGTFVTRALPVVLEKRDGSTAGEFCLLLLAERRTGWIRVRLLPNTPKADWRPLADNARKQFLAMTGIVDVGYVILMDKAVEPLHLPAWISNWQRLFQKHIAKLLNGYNLGRRWPEQGASPKSRLAMFDTSLTKKEIRAKIVQNVNGIDRGTIRMLGEKARKPRRPSSTPPDEQVPK